MLFVEDERASNAHSSLIRTEERKHSNGAENRKPQKGKKMKIENISAEWYVNEILKEAKDRAIARYNAYNAPFDVVERSAYEMEWSVSFGKLLGIRGILIPLNILNTKESIELSKEIDKLIEIAHHGE